MFIKIILDSKNLSSLTKFLVLFNNILKTKLSFSRLMKINSIVNNKKRITVLKSPHVNKSAQESFEVKNYKKVIVVFSLQYYMLFMVLKKLQNSIFNDINISIQAGSGNLKNFKFFKFFKVNNNKINFLNILKKLDISGECSLQSNFNVIK